MTTVHRNLEVVGHVDTFMLKKVQDLPFAPKGNSQNFLLL